MSLAITQVKSAVITRLAGTATLVTGNRNHPLAESDLPAWKVLQGDDDIETGAGGDIETHDAEIICAGYVRNVNDADAALDALAAAGLAAIHAVQASAFTVQTNGMSRRFVGEGEAAMGVIEIRLRSNFYTAPTAPETFL